MPWQRKWKWKRDSDFFYCIASTHQRSSSRMRSPVNRDITAKECNNKEEEAIFSRRGGPNSKKVGREGRRRSYALLMDVRIKSSKEECAQFARLSWAWSGGCCVVTWENVLPESGCYHLLCPHLSLWYCLFWRGFFGRDGQICPSQKILVWRSYKNKKC